MALVDGLDAYDIRVSGVRLNSHAFAVQATSGISQLPERDLIGIGAPGMNGVTAERGMYTTPPQFRLEIWVSDEPSGGGTPSAVQFEQNWNTLLRAFNSGGSLLTVERCMPDGTIRSAQCRVAGAVVPDQPRAGDSRYMVMEFVLDIPGIFWRDSAGPFTSSKITTLGAFTTLSTLTDGTAPVTDALITIAGPITNPYLETPAGGYITFAGTVAAGASWVIDCAAFTSKNNGSSVMSTTDYNGTYLFEIADPYQIKLTGSATSSATGVTVTADRKFF